MRVDKLSINQVGDYREKITKEGGSSNLSKEQTLF